MDFTDLSKACLKDAYTLLSIDKLVDGASKVKFLSFMDAYSSYYQRLMNKVFAKQIGRTMEVYVDDMVAKTVGNGEHCKDLQEFLPILGSSTCV